MECGAKTINLDLADESSIQDASRAFGDQPLDVLINCAGMLSPCSHCHGNSLPPAAGNGSEKWFDTTVDQFMQRFRISAVGPFLTVKAFYPQLKKSDSPLVVNLSSNVGSISSKCQQDSSTELSY
jgi:NAD(P)-dependent dehydrogenase (short-subunit alcohol dehydrogenase family)